MLYYKIQEDVKQQWCKIAALSDLTPDLKRLKFPSKHLNCGVATCMQIPQKLYQLCKHPLLLKDIPKWVSIDAVVCLFLAQQSKQTKADYTPWTSLLAG
jgi:hypothetical protein